MKFYKTQENQIINWQEPQDFGAEEYPADFAQEALPDGATEVTAEEAAAINEANYQAKFKHFKDKDNKLHFINEDFAYLLPPGSVVISEAEAEALRQPTPQQQQAEAIAAAKGELLSIDISSVRALREYLASLPDAPQILKDKEAAAIAARAKLA